VTCTQNIVSHPADNSFLKFGLLVIFHVSFFIFITTIGLNTRSQPPTPPLSPHPHTHLHPLTPQPSPNPTLDHNPQPLPQLQHSTQRRLAVAVLAELPIGLNIIFGIIVDTFSELRDLKVYTRR